MSELEDLRERCAQMLALAERGTAAAEAFAALRHGPPAPPDGAIVEHWESRATLVRCADGSLRVFGGEHPSITARIAELEDHLASKHEARLRLQRRIDRAIEMLDRPRGPAPVTDVLEVLRGG